VIEQDQSELLNRLLKLSAEEDVISVLDNPAFLQPWEYSDEALSDAMARLKQFGLENPSQQHLTQAAYHCYAGHQQKRRSTSEMEKAACLKLRASIFIPGRGWHYLSDMPDSETGQSMGQCVTGNVLGGLTGTSKITFCGGIHFKFNPKKPGIEYAIHALDTLLFPDQAVTNPSLFIKIRLPDGKIEEEALATQTVYGKTADKIPEENLQFEQAHFTQQCLLQLLTSPGDGKLDNFIISQDKLVGIDNEIAFEPEIIKGEGKKGHVTHIHTFLFFLLQMKACLDKNLIEKFKTLSVEKLFLLWLKELDARNALYERLDRNHLKITFDQGVLKSIYLRLKKIQQFFKTTHLDEITGENLFKTVMPEVFDYYQALNKKLSDQPLQKKIEALQKTKRGDEGALSFEVLNLSAPASDKVTTEYRLKVTEIYRQTKQLPAIAEEKPIPEETPKQAIENMANWFNLSDLSETEKTEFFNELKSGALPVQKLELIDETLTGEKLLNLTKKATLYYLYLEKTQIKLEDLKKLMSFPGCTGLELCLGENVHLGLETWQYLLHSPLFTEVSLKLPDGTILMLKSKNISALQAPAPSSYLQILSQQKGKPEYLRAIEKLLIQEGYPIKSFEACLSKQDDKTASRFIVSSLRYLIIMLESREASPERYLEYYLKLNKSWRKVFYQQISQEVLNKDRCQKIQNLIGEYPDSDGERRLSDVKEQHFRKQLSNITEDHPEPLLPQESIRIEGLTPGKACLDKNLTKKLINEGWIIAKNPVEEFGIQALLVKGESLTQEKLFKWAMEQKKAIPSLIKQCDVPSFFYVYGLSHEGKPQLTLLPNKNGQLNLLNFEHGAQLWVSRNKNKTIFEEIAAVKGYTVPQSVEDNFNFKRKKEKTKETKAVEEAEKNVIPAKAGTDKTTSSVQHGNHLVIPIHYINSQLHCKVLPDFPGMEIAYSLLSNRIMGKGSPQVELWKWTYGQHTYPVLVSETIEGENLTPQLLKDHPLEELSYQQHVLMAMLVNPGDGNPGNFIAQKIKASDGSIKLRLISIDNDRLFAPPFETGKLRAASIIYCFNEMQLPLHKDLRKTFLSLNAYEVLSEWLNSLETLNQQYCEIFTPQELEKFMSGELENTSSYLLTMLKRDTVAELFRKIKTLQYWLSVDPQMILMDLLSKIQPSLANHYQQMRLQYDEPIRRFEEAVKNEYRREEIQGVKRYTSTMHMGQYLKLQGREVTKDKTVEKYWQQDFDQAKKELKDLSVSREAIELAKLQLVQGNTKGFDDLPEAYAQEEVIAGIDFNREIRDHKGMPDAIQQQKLIWLIINSKGLKYLERLIIQHCAITDGQLEQLLSQLPKLRTLKLTNCQNINTIFYQTMLKKKIKNAVLEECILQDMRGLTDFSLTIHTLRYLSIKQAPNLKTFYFYSDSVTQLRFSDAPQCHQFDIYAKELQEADFSGNSLLIDWHLQKIVLQCQNIKQMNLQRCDEQKISYLALKETLPVFAEKVAQNQEETEFLKSAAGILSGIAGNQTKILDVEANESVSGWIWKCLCIALADNASVKEIKASGCRQLNDKDAIQLAHSLEKNQTVIKISLEANSIGDQGVIALAQALEKNQTIREINLAFNNIGDKGAAALIDMLQKNNVLRDIRLGANNISSSGIYKILWKNNRIDLESDEEGTVIVAILKALTIMVTIVGSKKFISDENYEANYFQLNPFTFFSEHADRENTLFFAQNHQQQLYASLVKSLEVWEASKANDDLDDKKSLELQKVAQSFGFKCNPIPKSGNCLFEAVSEQLKVILKDKKDHFDHKELRKLTVAFLMKHQEFYENFVEDHSFASFIHKMSMPGTWAENTALNALAHVLNVTIVVINSDGSAPIVLKKPHAQGIIYLGYEVDAHYQRLERDLSIAPEKSIEDFIDRAQALDTPSGERRMEILNVNNTNKEYEGFHIL